MLAGVILVAVVLGIAVPAGAYYLFGQVLRMPGCTVARAFLLQFALTGTGILCILLSALLRPEFVLVILDLVVALAAIVASVWLLRRLFRTTIWRAIGCFVLANAAQVGLALLLRAFAVESFLVPTGGMNPTLRPGDRLLADKVTLHFRQPRKADVVVFHPPHNPSTTFVQRVVATAGDRVDLREDMLYVNDRAAGPCPWGGNPLEGMTPPHYPFVVPPGKLFLLGDNRQSSLDSRYWGCADVSSVVGLARIIYASAVPPPRGGFHQWDTNPEERPGSVRWERIGKVIE